MLTFMKRRYTTTVPEWYTSNLIQNDSLDKENKQSKSKKSYWKSKMGSCVTEVTVAIAHSLCAVAVPETEKLD